MSKTENRASLLDSISDWIKLLGLIVLVGEAIILAAMSLTPKSNPIHPWYPVIMVFLLILVIVAVFFDRVMDRKSKYLSVKVDDREMSVDSSRNKGKKLQDQPSKYVNSQLGYSFDKPEGKDWSDPKEITYKEFIQNLFMLEDLDEEYLQKLVSANSPFGMLLYRAKILEVKNGESIVVNLDEQTTTESAEHTLSRFLELKTLEGVEYTEEDVIAWRQELNQTDEYSALAFEVKMTIMAFAKEDFDNTSIALSLPNFFLALSTASSEPIDSLTSNSDMILWATSNKLKNVLIDEQRYPQFFVYRLYQLVESEKYMYLCQVQWSPQMESAVFTWEELKKSFESFRIE